MFDNDNLHDAERWGLWAGLDSYVRTGSTRAAVATGMTTAIWTYILWPVVSLAFFSVLGVLIGLLGLSTSPTGDEGFAAMLLCIGAIGSACFIPLTVWVCRRMNSDVANIEAHILAIENPQQQIQQPRQAQPQQVKATVRQGQQYTYDVYTGQFHKHW